MRSLPNPAYKPTASTALLDTSRDSVATLTLFDMEDVTEMIERGESVARDSVLGYISAHSPEAEDMEWKAACGAFWQVGVAVSRKGWGPMLYDSLLGLAELDELDGIIPSRGSIQPSARHIWRVYAEQRPEVRVTVLPLGCRKYGEPYLDQGYLLDPELYLMLSKRGNDFVRTIREEYGQDIAGDLHDAGARMFTDHLQRRAQRLFRGVQS